MVGIVIVSHGDFGKALIESAKMILEEENKIVPVSISNINQNVESYRVNIFKAIDEVDNGEGVIIFTDLFGGTPCNLSISTIDVRNVEIIAGVNLPMILKILTLDEKEKYSLKKIANLVKEAGEKQIIIASELAA
jgi:PTS system mannose-specific IIA component